MRKRDELPENDNAQSGSHAGYGGEEHKAVPFHRDTAFCALLYHVLYLLTSDMSISRPGFTNDLVDTIKKLKIIFMVSTSVVGPVLFCHRLCYGSSGSVI